MTSDTGNRHTWIEATYWGATTGLLGFGILGMATIGWIFLLLGLTLLVLGPVRHRPVVFWPIAIFVVVGLLVYLLHAPAGCSATTFGVKATDGKSVERTYSTCTNLFGRVVR